MFETIREKLKTKKSYPWLIFASVTTATFMSNIDTSILNVALPTLEDYFSVNESTLQWVVISYLLVITGLLPVIGKLSDLIGRKIIFLFGIFVFILASVLCALSQSIEELIIFRSIQGIGGAILQGNVMSIIVNTFPKNIRGRALGLVGSVVAAGTIAGPFIGGLLIGPFSWRSIFWINVPIGILGIFGAYILLPHDRSSLKDKKMDVLGAIIFFVFTLTSLLYLSNGTSWGFTSTIELVLLGVSIISFVLFIFRETHTKEPLLNLSFFKIFTFTIGNIAGFVSFIMIMFPSLLISLYLSNVLGYEHFKIGMIMSIQAIFMFITAPFSGHISDKLGYQIPSILGMTIASLSLLLFSFLSYSVVIIWVANALFGIGMGLFQSPNNVSVLESVPLSQSGITGSIIATVRNFGRTGGAAITFLIFTLFLRNIGLTYSHTVSKAFLIGSFIGFGNVILIISRSFIKNNAKGTN